MSMDSILVGVIVVFAGVYLISRFRRGNSCGCGSGCSHCLSAKPSVADENKPCASTCSGCNCSKD